MSAKKRPDQVRRQNRKLITQLPAEGRRGDVPKWPLEAQSPMERKRWKEIWTKPQAVMWEAWHAEDVVAQYIRITVQAEEPGAPVMLLAERRQMQMQLGLLPGAWFKLQWTLTEQQEAEARSRSEVYAEAIGN